MLRYNKGQTVIGRGSEPCRHISRRAEDEYHQRRQQKPIARHRLPEEVLWQKTVPHPAPEIRDITQTDHISDCAEPDQAHVKPYHKEKGHKMAEKLCRSKADRNMSDDPLCQARTGICSEIELNQQGKSETL